MCMVFKESTVTVKTNCLINANYVVFKGAFIDVKSGQKEPSVGYLRPTTNNSISYLYSNMDLKFL